MKNRILALSCLCVLVLNLVGSAAADVTARKSAMSQANQLAALLPAVDAIVTLDMKRAFTTAIPRVLSAKQGMYSAITAGLDKMKADVGVDLRQFEYVAAGVVATKEGEKKYDVDPVIIARGPVSYDTLIAAAKKAANTKFREETAGGKTIYIFSAKAVTDQAKQQAPAAANQVANKMPKEIAVSSIDANTVVFGELALVRRTITERPAASSELLPLLAKNPTAIASFAGRLPEGMKSFVPLDNDELGKDIDAIRYVYGSMDMTTDSLVMSLTARTLQETQAKSLYDTVAGLQMLGKTFLGGSKAPDKQVYVRLIDGAKISTRANELMIDLTVKQSDLDILVGMLK